MVFLYSFLGGDTITEVTIAKDFIEISGHAPEKMVCHGISAISNMVASYLEDNQLADVIYDDGYLMIYNINREYRESDLIQAFEKGLQDISLEYQGNIEFHYQ